MQIIFGLILMSGAYCNVLRGTNNNNNKYYNSNNNNLQPSSARHHLYSKDLRDSVDEIYDTYVTISDDAVNRNYLDIFSRIQQIYLNRLHHSSMLPKTIIPARNRFRQSAYLLVKTERQRNKRYISSYLTLCHFKICNMGRKRTTRYIHMIRTLHDNDE